MASPTQWIWVWVDSGSLWWTGKPGLLRYMGSQRVGHDWVTELNWTEDPKGGALSDADASIAIPTTQPVMKVKVAQLCLTLCDPMDYTVHGIFQARILEWVAFPFSRGSSQPRDWTQVSLIAGGFSTYWATREAQKYCREALSIPPGTASILSFLLHSYCPCLSWKPCWGCCSSPIWLFVSYQLLFLFLTIYCLVLAPLTYLSHCYQRKAFKTQTEFISLNPTHPV